MSTPTILIVEDDENIRELYSDALTNAKLHVLKAENGNEGVELALKHHPEVILMDIVMPDLNGHAAVTMLRKDAWGKNAKIIFLTNMSDAENIVHAVDEGSEEYIIKANTTPKEVVNMVRVVMNM